MAAATWADHDTNGRLTRALNDARALLDGDDDDDASVGSSGLSVILPAPAAAEPHFMVVRRFLLRHIGWVYAIQETLLLLMIGVSANLLAFLLDHLIEALVMGRAAAAQAEGSFLPSYAVWTGSALVLCALSAMVVQFIGPASAGSGIPQMKSVLGGMRMHNYLSLRTMVAKMLSLVLALAGGLSVGKEGPYVHITSCAAACLTRLPGFRRLGQASRLADEALRQQMLSAACAAGVAATFGAPVGGVLFSIEVTSTYYSVQHLWKSLFASVCGALVFRGMRDTGSLGQGFRKTDFGDMDQLLHNGEIYAFALLGCVCGLVGAGFVHATSSLISLVASRIEALLGFDVLAPLRGDCSSATALEALLSRYGPLPSRCGIRIRALQLALREDTHSAVINELFRPNSFDMAARWANPSLTANLAIYVVCKFVFTCIAVGCPISCGVFTPVFLIGAAGGRLFGELLNDITPVDVQITAGGYAVVGAAALAAGVTRTVIVFELTGQLSHMLPVLVAVLLAYGVGNACNTSIYDTMMTLNKLPYIQPLKPHHASSRCAHDVMDATLKPLCVPCTFADAHRLLLESEALEFALVDAGGALLGAVPRAYLDLQIEHILCSSDGGRKRPAPLLDKIATKMTEALGSPRSWTITRHLSLTSLGVGDGDNRRSRRSLARSRSLDRSSLGGELARQQPLAPAPAEPSDSTELTAMTRQHQPQPQQTQPQTQQPQQTQHQPPQHQQTPQPQPPPQQTTTQQPLPATTTASASLAAATPDAACAVQPSGSADALSASPASVSPSAASSGSDTQRASTGSTAAGRPGNPSPAPGLGIERAPSRMTRAQRLQRRNSGLVSPSFGVPPSAASSPGGEFTESELALLDLPLDLGVLPLGTDESMGIGRSRPTAVNHAPTVVLAATSLATVHMQFSLFATEHAYVTYAGRYVGVIRRSQLTGEEGGVV
ncbi:hypothetical protein EMIHUDRAFT_95008 [Emiliania huxleyi CCMP1516]|uniref:Chloride channel protein n=2 Tax=Emiliania huxleyi TaxID=2903 RepID=A0A0D3L196_EMIH1|nr:hypothetical protein EMIHUDRAFT_95008 [Emiliania huxleyi CCMP1516]EOD41781.1 hypothetical protein EMIHUDRAFT_95008 [Emiliania huxleyi CCMP1516]|eukprot:XP_005794210.1 hypothetical protein EMIHUDRAFT_95008 [Emiliania huxleyi CCMP1516]